MKLDWLVESISKKVAVDSDKFVYQLNNGKPNAMADEQATAPSPASKRNILLMSGQTPKQATPKRLNFNDSNASILKDQSVNEKTMTPNDVMAQQEDEIIDQYLRAPAPVATKVPPTTTVQAKVPAPEPVAGPSKLHDGFKVPAQPIPACESDNFSDLDSESEYASNVNQVMFLASMKVFISGFDMDSHESLVEDCRIAGAEVIDDKDFSGAVDILILPVDAVSMDDIKAKAKIIVNHNWLVRI